MEAIDSRAEGTEMPQAQTHLYKHIFNYMYSLSLKCALDLRIPDVIHSHGKPITLSELISSLNLDPSKATYMYRLMRFLVHSDIFAAVKQDEEQEEAYVLTPTSNLLVRHSPNTLAQFARSLLEKDFFPPWFALGEWFQGEETVTPFEKANKVSFWDHNLRKTMFNEAMARDSHMMYLAIRDCKSVFEGLESLVDVGGGNGSLARIISEAFPRIKCTVLEVPQAVANLTGTDNLSFVAGDMFKHIPPADAIILKLVLHGWRDEECVKILKKCKEAISGKGEGAKVMIIEEVIPEKNKHELTEIDLFYDLMAMIVVTGKERTEKEWKKLFGEAGFNHYNIIPLVGSRSLIEVYP